MRSERRLSKTGILCTAKRRGARLSGPHARGRDGHPAGLLAARADRLRGVAWQEELRRLHEAPPASGAQMNTQTRSKRWPGQIGGTPSARPRISVAISGIASCCQETRAGPSASLTAATSSASWPFRKVVMGRLSAAAAARSSASAAGFATLRRTGWRASRAAPAGLRQGRTGRPALWLASSRARSGPRGSEFRRASGRGRRRRSVSPRDG